VAHPVHEFAQAGPGLSGQGVASMPQVMKVDADEPGRVERRAPDAREAAPAELGIRTVLVERIVERVKAQHPYEVPGISARPIIAGNPEYLRWIRDETDGTNG